MATEAKVKANRMNALKSTGPKSKEGKEVVSQNATKHGLCSCRNVIKSESQNEYDQFHDEMIEDLSPAGAMEYSLAERIVNLSWRLKRAEILQNAVIESFTDDLFHSQWDSNCRAKNQAEEGDMSLALGRAIRNDFSDSKILEQLLVYERRIESSLYKAMNELKKMQKMRKAEERKQETNLTETRNETREAKDEAATQPRDDRRKTKDERENAIHKPLFPNHYPAKQSQFSAVGRSKSVDELVSISVNELKSI